MNSLIDEAWTFFFFFVFGPHLFVFLVALHFLAFCSSLAPGPKARFTMVPGMPCDSPLINFPATKLPFTTHPQHVDAAQKGERHWQTARAKAKAKPSTVASRRRTKSKGGGGQRGE